MQKNVPLDGELRLFVAVLQSAGRRGGLPEADIEDFIQNVHVRLLETDYALFRQFKGQSALKTYLSTVANHLVQDWKNHIWGKWRPSAIAVRLGPIAVELERLTVRDGLEPQEAIATLRCRPGAPSSVELEALARAIPTRQRRKMLSTDVLEHLPSQDARDPLVAMHQDREQRLRLRVLAELLEQLPPDDRHLIAGRYLSGRQVPEIARELGQDPKHIYRRCERLLGALRREFTLRGLDAPDSASA